MNRQGLITWLVILGSVLLFFMLMRPGTSTSPTKVPESVFITHIDKGEITSVTIQGPQITGVLKDGKKISTYATDSGPIVKALTAHHVKFGEKEPSHTDDTLMLIMKLAIPIVIILFLFQMMKKAGQGPKNMMGSVSSHKGTIANEKTVTTRFSDVAGIDEAVEEARDIVDFLKNPQNYGSLGARVPKGILLVGPPGTGKTLLARAIAGEAGVPFIAASGSSFIEMFVGVGAARVRDLFKDAQKNAPCIIFIDELDAVGKRRGGVSFGSGGNDEREQTLNEILTTMDGFAPGSGIIVIGASNRPDVLDSALTRPGRFDRKVHVTVADVKGRESILKVHARKIRLAPEVDLSTIAKGTPGMTGADLEGLLNDAATIAGKAGKDAVGQEEIEMARDRALMGPERRSAVLSEKEKHIVSYHESGHAIAGWFNKYTDPVHRVSIIPRGMALGVTQALPQEDKRLHSRNGLLGMLRMLLGGRVAEEIAIGDITSGASDDLNRATEVAKSMVTQLGMVEDVGLRTFGKRDQGYLAYDYEQRDYSERTAERIDDAVQRLITEAHEEVVRLLKDKRHLLDEMAKELREKETLTAEDVARILGPRPSPGGNDEPAS